MQINIRGIMATEQTERGDPSAAFHVDGMYIGRPEAQLGSFLINRAVAPLGAPAEVASGLSVMFNIPSPGDPKAWLEIMPQVIHVHGKFYDFDDQGFESSIPYQDLLPEFVSGGYQGGMSSEWDGHLHSLDDGFERVRKHQALCRRILASLQPA